MVNVRFSIWLVKWAYSQYIKNMKPIFPVREHSSIFHDIFGTKTGSLQRHFDEPTFVAK